MLDHWLSGRRYFFQVRPLSLIDIYQLCPLPQWMTATPIRLESEWNADNWWTAGPGYFCSNKKDMLEVTTETKWQSIFKDEAWVANVTYGRFQVNVGAWKNVTKISRLNIYKLLARHIVLCKIYSANSTSLSQPQPLLSFFLSGFFFFNVNITLPYRNDSWHRDWFPNIHSPAKYLETTRPVLPGRRAPTTEREREKKNEILCLSDITGAP